MLPELASIRITAYEESGRFIGHRVLPVVGLCPGYRHVNLRTELGQPLPMAALFLHIVVKDYVPHGLSDFAEALANPIKYQSDLEKRAEQLSVFTDDVDPVEAVEVPNKKTSLTRTLMRESAPNGSPTHKTPSIAAATGSLDISIDNDFPPCPLNLSTTGSSSEYNSILKTPETKEEKEEIVAEPLDKILDNKLVKEKKLELDKKLESLRKKHEKEKKKMTSLHSQKSGELSGEKRSFINIKLVKKLSKPNM